MKLWDSIKQGASALSEKTAEMAGVARLRLKLGKIKEQIKEKELALGTLVYGLFKEDRSDPAAVTSLCQEIAALEQQAAAVEK